jgi:hypothetical protein
VFALPLARPLIAGDALRMALCLLFVLGNPAVETYGNVANLHWWLCVGALVLVSVPLEGRCLVPLACAMVVVTTLSSPLPVLLVPLVLLTIVVGGRRYRATGISLLVGAALQLLARLYLTGEEPDLPDPRSIGEVILFTLDACRATLLQLLPGYELAARLHEWHEWAAWMLAGPLFVGLVGRALLPWCWRQGLLAGGAVYVLTMTSAVPVLTRYYTWPSAYLLRTPVPLGGRYAFVPYAACIFLLGLAVQRGLVTPTVRARAPMIALLLAVFVCSVAGRPPMIELDDLEWRKHASEARQRGEVTIPINPPGWTVKLKMAPD